MLAIRDPHSAARKGLLPSLCIVGQIHLPNSKHVSFSPSMDSFTRVRAPSRIRAISALLQFGTRSQITLGGLPQRTLRSRKSESFDTIAYPSAFAYSQISASVAFFRLQSRTWAELGLASANNFVS